MNNRPRKDIIHSELDIKNKVLEDKRKSMIKVLKDKRPTRNENSFDPTTLKRQSFVSSYGLLPSLKYVQTLS